MIANEICDHQNDDFRETIDGGWKSLCIGLVVLSHVLVSPSTQQPQLTAKRAQNATQIRFPNTRTALGKCAATWWQTSL